MSASSAQPQDPSPESSAPDSVSTTETTEAPKKAKTFPVVEIFGPTIQGEGSTAGQQTMFVRFGLCDYRCLKCDSMHAVEPRAVKKHATWMTAEEIASSLAEVKKQTGVQWVTFSGGNPAMHKLEELVYLLHQLGFSINVETQGTLNPEWLNACEILTISPKSPGMGEKFEEKKFRTMVATRLGYGPMCIKVVVFSALDLEFALSVEGIFWEEWWEAFPGIRLIDEASFYLSLGNSYQPVLDENLDLVENPANPSNGWDSTTAMSLKTKLLADYRALAEDLLVDPRLKSWRFLPQLHVLAWGNEAER